MPPSFLPLPSTETPIPDTNWRRGNGVAGGWDQLQNGDCSFLTNGEERNWWFQGEEDWDFPKTEAVATISSAATGGSAAAAIESEAQESLKMETMVNSEFTKEKGKI
jgi:hypothetical protein